MSEGILSISLSEPADVFVTLLLHALIRDRNAALWLFRSWPNVCLSHPLVVILPTMPQLKVQHLALGLVDKLLLILKFDFVLQHVIDNLKQFL